MRLCGDPKEYCKRQRRFYTSTASNRRVGSEAELNALGYRYKKYCFVLETFPSTQMRAFLDECRRICAEVEAAKTVLQRLVLKVTYI